MVVQLYVCFYLLNDCLKQLLSNFIMKFVNITKVLWIDDESIIYTRAA